MSNDNFAERLEEHFRFPARYKVVLFKEQETNKQSIVITQMSKSSEKKKLENIKLNEAQSFIFYGSSTPIDVYDFATAQEAADEIARLNKIWAGTLTKEFPDNEDV